jgi:hypothetical protein
MSNLSICIPSHRNLIDSQRSIDSAIDYSLQREGVEVSISDNSNDQYKSSKYSSKSIFNLKYEFTPKLNESENWYNSAKNSTGEYLGFLADDDYIISIGQNSEFETDKKIVGYRPNFAIWENERGIIGFTNFECSEITAKDRVASYFKNCKGNNNTLYSFIKRNISLDINTLVMQHHPVKSGYYDWAIVLAYISSGALLSDHSSLYVYDNCNWSGPQERINDAIMKLMLKGGLDTRGHLFLPLLLAVDSFILIARKTSPVDRAEVLEAASYAFQIYANHFINSYVHNPSQFLPQEIIAISEMRETTGLSKLLLAALKVIEAYTPQIVDQYKELYQASIGEAWGKFN